MTRCLVEPTRPIVSPCAATIPIRTLGTPAKQPRGPPDRHDRAFLDCADDVRTNARLEVGVRHDPQHV
jgi:hypothetical protein